jgi:aspartate-semialdehyde dehydrogenase
MKKKSKYNVAVVGVGAVGIEMLRCLRNRNFPVGELRVLARSAREIEVDNRKYQVQAISPEAFKGIDIALFAGTEGEKGAAVTFAAEAVRRGAVVIDNGADFRMDPNVPLVVP